MTGIEGRNSPFGVGMMFHNKHNGRLVVITEIRISDTGNEFFVARGFDLHPRAEHLLFGATRKPPIETRISEGYIEMNHKSDWFTENDIIRHWTYDGMVIGIGGEEE